MKMDAAVSTRSDSLSRLYVRCLLCRSTDSMVAVTDVSLRSRACLLGTVGLEGNSQSVLLPLPHAEDFGDLLGWVTHVEVSATKTLRALGGDVRMGVGREP